MRMTSLEIQNHRFARRLSGYDTEEVETFLGMAADDCESRTRENQELKEHARHLELRVKELSETETVLRQTLVSAQAMSDELRQTAVREAEVMLGEAELRAERILDASHRRAARLSEDVRELRGLRKRLATSLRSTMHTHLAMIDSLDPEHAEAEVDFQSGNDAEQGVMEKDTLPPQAPEASLEPAIEARTAAAEESGEPVVVAERSTSSDRSRKPHAGEVRVAGGP